MDNFIGFLAAICTTASFIPQAFKVFKTKKVNDISLGMFLLMSFGVALWDVYGIVIEALPIIVANTITLVLSIYILIMKLKLNNKQSYSDNL
ncbi:MAG TPA: SemiSWEET transporter [Ignavibacteriaceae bacterium]|nr:SemiSWEET transporter [Ignavibacteriaceae bacterium]